MSRSIVVPFRCLSLGVIVISLAIGKTYAQRQMETIGRGVVAVRSSATQIYVGWRMLGTDPDDIGFNVYRSSNGGVATKINGNLPVTATTDFVDAPPSLNVSNTYFVRPVLNAVEQSPSASFTVPPNSPLPRDHQNNIAPYLSLPLQIPVGGTTPDGVNYTYSPNDASIGDLDGDGEYEIILKWDPSNSKDNSQSGHTGPVYLDAYKLNGTRLWRINLGKNIRAGAHYTQFMVYDLDGDGRAELACRTAPGTVDGLGSFVLLGADNPNIAYANSSGYILTGPEYLTIFDGLTGAELATTNFYPDRVNVSQWGDTYGNRVDRFLAGIAYVDGVRPSLIMARGYYGPQFAGGQARNEITAWNWRNGQLKMVWWFKAGLNINGNINSSYISQGNHQLSIADVDGDGRDEIIYGACSINDNGTGLYTTGLHHGDALHVSDMDPGRPGIEVWDVHEVASSAGGGEFRDSRKGSLIYGLVGTGDTGRGMASHIDGRYEGYQMWSSVSGGVYDRAGNLISGSTPSINFAVWWDADLQRELLDNAGGGGASTKLDKWTGNGVTRLLSPYSVDIGARNNNGTKSNPCLSGDILGDWREEMVLRRSDNAALMIFVSPRPATNRFRTLLHDPQYRVALAWQNVAYNQPPHPGFYIGAGMSPAPRFPVSDAELAWRGGGGGNAWDAANNWFLNGVWTNDVGATFSAGQSVVFDLRGRTNPVVNLTGSVSPASVKVHSPSNYTFQGAGLLSGDMNLIKAGTGQLTINNTNDYTGVTLASGGTLFVNGRLMSSPVTIERRGEPFGFARVGGRGVLGGGLSIQQDCELIVGPGTNSPGTLTVVGSMTELGDVVNHFDLSSDPNGSSNDTVVVQGNLSLSGVNVIQINHLDGYLANGVYPLFSYTGSLAGGLPNLVLSGEFIQPVALTNPPGQIAIVVSQPIFTGASLVGGNVVFEGGGGNASQTFYVLKSADVTMPLDSWTRVATNQFDGVGQFNFSLPIQPGLAQEYFILEVP